VFSLLTSARMIFRNEEEKKERNEPRKEELDVGRVPPPAAPTPANKVQEQQDGDLVLVLFICFDDLSVWVLTYY